MDSTSSESEDDLIDEVNDVMSNVFGTSNSDHGDNEELDDGTFEANSSTDNNTDDDDMEIDITW